MKRREIARHHAIAFSLIKNPGAPDRRVHTLYLIGNNGETEPFIPLIEYFIEQGRTRALSWQREMARSVGLFIDFLASNANILRDQPHPKVLAAFAECLVGGTVGMDGTDASGLYWQPKEVSRSMRLLRSLTMFSDWMENRYGNKKINPWRDATVGEQIAYWRRLDRRNAATLLGYATYKSDHLDRSKMARSVAIPRKRTVAIGREAKIFPRERIWDLLTNGFIVPGKQKSPYLHERLNLKDILITILLHGGGLRESEPFHLYVTDVGVDPKNPNSALVRIYHPEQGMAPADYIDPLSGKRIHADREEYLRVKWQMQPRNQVEGRFKAGWKDLMLFDEKEKFAYVHWFPSIWGEIFLAFFKLYINHCRSRHCNHPFLFVSQKDGYDGDPYTVDSYRQAHERAVKRIGLVAAKDLGTTPHGHRHAYGQSLSDTGVDEITIQRIMHHKSQASQSVYTDPPAMKIADALNKAQARANEIGLTKWEDKARDESFLLRLVSGKVR